MLWRCKVFLLAAFAVSLLCSAALAIDINAENRANIDATNALPPTGAGVSASPPIVEKKFGEWTLQCATHKAMNPPCQVVYRLTGSGDSQVMVVISMAKAAQNTVGFQMALPLGFSIQNGVRIEFGPKFSTKANVSRCTIKGCLIEGIAPANLLAAMLQAKTGQISIQMMQGNTVALAVKLDGFREAFDAMSAYKS
jgi:invasion protein IalB